MTAVDPLTMNAAPGPLSGLWGMFQPLRWFRRRMLRKPASTLLASVGMLFAGVIVMNALAMQTERHPAPMFTALIEERAVALPTQSIPLPPVRPEGLERKKDTAARDTRVASSQRDEPVKHTGSAKDQMLAIIKGGAPDASADSAARALQVQRALNKAGYGPLKEDGVLGPGTKQALERFESDRKLPVRGEAQGRTARELARLSGVAID